MKTYRHSLLQRGMTLIEIMIAMLIGVFLIAGMLQVFISAKQAYRLQENLSRLQENGRFAMDILTKDIRMAGFSGCASKTVKMNSILDPTKVTIPALTTGTNGVDGTNVTATSWNGVVQSLACGSPGQCIAGTDVLNIQTSTACNGQLTSDADNSAQIFIATPNTCGLGQDDIAIVSDCEKADIFQITNNPGDGSVPGNGKQNFSHGASGLNCQPKLGSVNCQPNSAPNITYKKGSSEILAPRLYSYYIRTGTGNSFPSLWRSTNAKPASATNPVELVEGVEDMQILYGVDTDLTTCTSITPTPAGCYVPNYYVPATSVTDWSQVVSIRINLLIVSLENNLVDSPQPYAYNGTKVTPAKIYANATDTSQVCPAGTTAGCKQVDDLRLRRVFSSTIAVRNRLL